MTNKSRLPIGTALQVSYFFNSWMLSLTMSALALEHSLIHLAQVQRQLEPLARDAHQLLVSSLTSSFQRFAKSAYFVFLRS